MPYIRADFSRMLRERRKARAAATLGSSALDSGAMGSPASLQPLNQRIASCGADPRPAVGEGPGKFRAPTPSAADPGPGRGRRNLRPGESKAHTPGEAIGAGSASRFHRDRWAAVHLFLMASIELWRWGGKVKAVASGAYQ